MMSHQREHVQRNPEAVMVEKLLNTSLTALAKVLKRSKEIGGKLPTTEPRNPFVDRPILAKVECEQVIIEAFSRDDLPISLVSREHGNKKLHSDPKYLLVLDGLDGAASFMGKGPRGSHGTLFTLLSSVEPSYGDYVCAGMADFKGDCAYMAVRGKGLEMIDKVGRRTRIELSSVEDKTRPNGLVVCGGGSYSVYGQRLAGLNPVEYCSWVDSLRRLFDGKSDALVESTRKGNIEQAAVYAMVREAGGAVISLDGQDIGIKGFQTFGQLEAKGIIAARNAMVAEKLRQMLVT